MKKLNLFPFLTILAVLISFTACGDDDNKEETHTTAEAFGGTYGAIDSLNVNGSTEASWSSKTEDGVQYTVKANSDNTIDLTIPAESYKGLNMVGDITLSSYTIKNIPWVSSKGAFYLEYGSQNLPCTFTSSTMPRANKEYTLNSDSCRVTVSKDLGGNRLRVSNTFRLSNKMPVTIYVTFSGAKITL